MLPVVARPARGAREIVLDSWRTVAASIAVWPRAAGWVYAALAALAGVALVASAHRLYAQTRRAGNPKPMRFFHLSNSYLAFVFVAVAVDTFVR